MKREFISLLKKTYIFVIPAILINANYSLAQEKSEKIIIGETVTIYSKILDEERKLIIYKPVGYDQSQEKYPVLYMLDAHFIFYYATGFLQGLHRLQRIPGMILVGILNTDRNRDMNPSKSNTRTGGGADNFIKFLKEELIPFVDKNYRTEPYRILFGISSSGMFTIYNLLTAPDIFNAYFASSPSLWWDNRLLLKVAETTFEKQTKYESHKFLYIALGGRDDIWIRDSDHILSSTKSFCKILEKKAPDKLEWHLETFKHGDHQTTPMFFLPVALETLYSNWRLPQTTMDAGIEAVQNHFKSLSEKLGYEIHVPESAYNALGYNLMNQQKYEEAIEVFILNIKLYPHSANVYDSLGEAYMNIGNKELAVKNYKKSLGLNPQNDNAVAMLNRIREK